MTNTKDGSMYAPFSKVLKKACGGGDFPVSVVGLDHGHIYGMVGGILEAGANLIWVWDSDPQKILDFQKVFPKLQIAESAQQVYDCSLTKMILSSIVPNERWEIGLKSLQHGKHYMSDKPGFTELSQVDAARELVKKTGLRWSICFSERLQVESAIYAGQLIDKGAIGKVVQVLNIAPHRIAVDTRPDWFFDKEKYGGILCDIGSHQIDQILYFTGSKSGKILLSQVGNFAYSQYSGLEDFGDCTLQLDSGATGYFRLDWLTPEGLGTWGDGRLFILGTEGYIEVRKYINVGISSDSDTLYLVNHDVQETISCKGKTGFPYFGQLICDCLEDTDFALPQEHVFEVSRLAIEAEHKALRLVGFKQ